LERLLLDAASAPSTRRKNERAFDEFSGWCDARGVVLHSPASIDTALVNWFTAKYREDYSPGIGHSALAGVKREFPWAEGQLFLAARALRGWAKLKPTQKRPPLTWPVTCAMACRAIMYGHFMAGACMLLSFSLLLRIGEALNLRIGDIGARGDPRMGGAPDVWVKLRHTKTGDNLSVQADEEWAVRLLELVIRIRKARGAGPEHSLFGLSETQYRTVFRSVCKSWGMPGTVVPHSLRHGGATHRILVRKEQFHDVRRHGRWAADKSMDYYCQGMAASALSAVVPAQASRWGERIGKDVVDAVRSAVFCTPVTKASLHRFVADAQL
jgi:integrase